MNPEIKLIQQHLKAKFFHHGQTLEMWDGKTARFAVHETHILYDGELLVHVVTVLFFAPDGSTRSLSGNGGVIVQWEVLADRMYRWWLEDPKKTRDDTAQP